jgi:hypothetical protein
MQPIMRKSSKSNRGPTLIPLFDVDVDLVRPEANLDTIGFFACTKATSETHYHRERELVRDGKLVRSSLDIDGRLGLPTTADRDKFNAMVKLSEEQIASNGGVLKNPIRFTGAQMIRELDLARTGDIYTDIEKWGKRMLATTITSTEVIFLATKKKFYDSDKSQVVFQSFERVGLGEGPARQEAFEVVLADWLLDNINQRYVVPQNWPIYKQLKGFTTKGLYSLIHRWFKASKGGAVEKDYSDLCKLLNIKEWGTLSQAKAKLAPALKELVKHGYLSQWDIRTRVTKDGFKVILAAGPVLLRFLEEQRKKEKPNSDRKDLNLSEAQERALQMLLEEGVVPQKAKTLLKDMSADQIIGTVEYVRSQLAKPRNKIDNPAGLIIYQLEASVPVPAAFLTSKHRSETDKAREQQRRHEQEQEGLHQEYLLWVDKRVNQEIHSRYTATQLTAEIQEIMSVQGRIDTQTREVFRRMGPEAKENLAMQILRREVKETMEIQRFEDWARSNTQTALF